MIKDASSPDFPPFGAPTEPNLAGFPGDAVLCGGPRWVGVLVEWVASTAPHHTAVTIAVHDTAQSFGWERVSAALFATTSGTLCAAVDRAGGVVDAATVADVVDATLEVFDGVAPHVGAPALVSAVNAALSGADQPDVHPSTVCPALLWVLARLYLGWVPAPQGVSPAATPAEDHSEVGPAVRG